MSDEVKARVFEPFFTTKDVNKATGLGLASIYGFAQQFGVDVHVYSELDRGTVSDVYLPRYLENVLNTADDKPVIVQLTKGVSRILVVEDNVMGRKLTVERLHMLGHETVQASNGPQAIKILKADAAFDLIFVRYCDGRRPVRI
ncbi:MAG: hypothetical protein ACI9UN_004805 [Granulosicoccus sp.]|jgi:hypothetical protein